MTIKVRKVLTFEGKKKIGTGEEHMDASGVLAGWSLDLVHGYTGDTY